MRVEACSFCTERRAVRFPGDTPIPPEPGAFPGILQGESEWGLVIRGTREVVRGLRTSDP